MGRSRQGGATWSAARLYGPGYNAFRKRMFGPGGWGATPACYHCHHQIAPGLGEVQHLISPKADPPLSQEPSNCRPVHSGGRKRCPVCGLACQIIAAGNLAPRDGHGRPLPWDKAFIAARMADRAAKLARTGQPSGQGRSEPAAPAGQRTYPAPVGRGYRGRAMPFLARPFRAIQVTNSCVPLRPAARRAPRATIPGVRIFGGATRGGRLNSPGSSFIRRNPGNPGRKLPEVPAFPACCDAKICSI